jgi:DNA-binding transcriptional LysR family regulator
MEDAENSLSSAAMTPRGRLRVDVPSPLARLILVPALPAFHARYPDIQFDMGVSDRVVDLIGDNVDCVLRGGEINDQSLIARHVGDLQIGVYVAPAMWNALAPLRTRELENTDHRIVGFLSSRTGKIDPLVLRSGSEHIEITGRYVLAVDDGNAYLEAGLAGLGVIALPTYMAAAHQAVAL